MAGRYVQAILGEIKDYATAHSCPDNVDSMYFGGGTPSVVEEKHITAILEECRREYQIQDDCEVSLEANPGTISESKLKAYRKEGINRISVGAQSFADQELAIIGRRHNASMVFDAVKQLKESGFDNISLDLMLGLPCQTRASWLRNLEAVKSLEVHHISIYMLDLDDQCPLHFMISEGSARLPEDDLVSDLYLETLDFLSALGYSQYEISNFARPGYACRHNLKYWQRKPVQGFGVGSHSFNGVSRYANTSSMDNYLEAMESGSSPVDWQELVSKTQALQETLFLGLRLTEGVNWKCLQHDYEIENLAKYEEPLRGLSDRALLRWAGDNICLTASGMLVSNEIFQLFV
jgi:putative oxygen-independent coproporphyrinogen III oxidase